jgi:hypothetical protein
MGSVLVARVTARRVLLTGQRRVHWAVRPWDTGHRDSGIRHTTTFPASPAVPTLARRYTNLTRIDHAQGPDASVPGPGRPCAGS